MIVLGISCFYHDSSACIIKDGKILAAAQEERFSRVKNTGEFPKHAINFCVQSAGITFADIDAVAYFEKPYLKFARVCMDHLASFPFSLPAFLRSMPKWLNNRLFLSLHIREELSFKGPIYFIKHHMSHAASSFLASPFKHAAILTADGVGEWATLSCGYGNDTDIHIQREIHYPHSLGLLYTTVTTYLGFDAHGGEGKTMGMAGYGEPRYLAEFRKMIDIKPDGSFRMDPRYFAFRNGRQMWSTKFEKLLGPARPPNSPYEQRHYDIAASLQAILEEILISIARQLQQETGAKALCLAGGVTLNCVANKKILDQTGFEDVFIQPAAGDAGGSIGAALYVYHTLEKNPRDHSLQSAYLGPEFSNREILKALTAAGVPFRQLAPDELTQIVAQKLHDKKTVGWFQGRMEFGPRALGNRSILGSPCHNEMKEEINQKIKRREAFRPFAPLILKEKASEYFDLQIDSPYMLLAPQVLAQQKERVPAITHADGTARVQTIGNNENPRMRQLLVEFQKLSGVPVLINTSFNRKGEPVVCRPEHAIDCFLHTQMDCLAIGDYLLER